MGSPKPEERIGSGGDVLTSPFDPFESALNDARMQAIREMASRTEVSDLKLGDEFKDIGSKFKKEHSFEARKAMADKMLAMNKGLPVIAERLHPNVALPDTLKPKFLVPPDLTIPQFVKVLLTRLPKEAVAMSSSSNLKIFLHDGAKMAGAKTIGEIYAEDKDKDNFLYLTYADTWRPIEADTGLDMTMQEFDKMLQNRAQIIAEEELDEPDVEKKISVFRYPQLKGITVQQPVADAMLLGLKKVEGRNFALKLPKRGGMWLALHVGKSLDFFTNYQVMNEVRRLWPECPLIPTNRKRMGCIVGLVHVKECMAAHVCHDPWKSIPRNDNYYFVIDQVLPLPRAIPHRHSFQMWTVQEPVCNLIVDFVSGRKGRLLEYPRLPKPAVLVEGYQQDPKARARSAAAAAAAAAEKAAKKTTTAKRSATGAGRRGRGRAAAGVAADEVPPAAPPAAQEDVGSPRAGDGEMPVADKAAVAGLEPAGTFRREENVAVGGKRGEAGGEGDGWMDEDMLALAEDEEQRTFLAASELHPLERQLLAETEGGRRWEKLHQTASRTAAEVAPPAAGPAVGIGNVTKERKRIFFLEKLGPEQAVTCYRNWVRDTARTIREKLLYGRTISTTEWEERQKAQEGLPVVFAGLNKSEPYWKSFPSWHDTDYQERIRWDDLLRPDTDDEDSDETPAGSTGSSSSSGIGPLDERYDNMSITPAYQTEAIIDHLGILPPEAVKRSVLEALTPLTAEEQLIHIRAKNGTVVAYDSEEDQGTYRLRPGARPESVSVSDLEEGALYVPKVGQHRPAVLPTAGAAMADMVDAPEMPQQPAAGDEEEDVQEEAMEMDGRRRKRMRRPVKNKQNKEPRIEPPNAPDMLDYQASEE